MPTLEVLDTLKKHINELGDEPRILEERGESLVDVSPSESPVDSDLEQLLEEDGSQGGIDEMEALLGSYSEDLGEIETAQDGLDSFDDFNLDDFEVPEDIAPEEISPEGGTPKDIIPEDVLPEDAVLEDSNSADEGLDDFSLDDLDFGEAEDAFNDEIPVESTENIADDMGSEEELSLDGPGSDEELSGLDDLSLDDIDSDSNVDEELSGLDDFPSDDTTDATLEDLSLEEEPLSDISDDGELSFDDPGIDGDEESSPIDDVEDLEELGDLEDFESPVEDDSMTDLPDVESAVEDLGDLDSLEDNSADALSLDDDLNFEEELGADALTDITDLDDDSQQFSMDDFGDQYNFKEDDDLFAGDLGVDLGQLEQSLDEAVEDEEKPFSLSEDEYEAIIETLSTLPRNLKIALEELLADERRSPVDLKPIIDALIAGESPKSLAARFRTLTKRKIELPRSYEKRSGLALEQRRASLLYRLIREGWPVIRMVLLIISVSWILGASIFMWVYRPLKANKLYQAGLDAIKVDDVEAAQGYFLDAWDGWPLFYSEETDSDKIADSPIVVKGWKIDREWLLYARALRRRKHWDSAMQYYEGYLAVKPDSKDVRLEYARFLSGVLGKYKEAFDLIESSPVTGRVEWDRDYTLAEGDILLDWGEDDPTKYEEARKRYAKVLELSRNDERAILSMMRYHLRLKDSTEIERLLPIFNNEIAGKTDSPELAAEVFAGLGNYELAKGNAKEARRFINLAISADPQAPEPSFIDAMYWRQAGDGQRELSAYKRTLVNLEGRESLTRRNLEIRILTLGGMGRLQALSGKLADAESSYRKSISLYEDARNRNQLGASPEFGQIYLDLGNLKYGGIQSGGLSSDLMLSLTPGNEVMAEGSERYSELLLAERYYTEAEKLFSGNRRGLGVPLELLYRRGYVRYVLGLDDALLDFHRVARLKPEDYEVRLALAAVLLKSGDFEASRSQYARTLSLLDNELRRTGGVLNPLEKQSHAELLLRYIIAWNNLGVARARSAARGGGEDDYAAALGAFTMASEYLDEVYTDMPELITRGASALREIDGRRIIKDVDGLKIPEETTTIPYLNRMKLLGLTGDKESLTGYLMYPDIPSDLRGN